MSFALYEKRYIQINIIQPLKTLRDKVVLLKENDMSTVLSVGWYRLGIRRIAFKLFFKMIIW